MYNTLFTSGGNRAFPLLPCVAMEAIEVSNVSEEDEPHSNPKRMDQEMGQFGSMVVLQRAKYTKKYCHIFGSCQQDPFRPCLP